MSDNHDYLALDWVKGEIEETLKQAQQALEAYVDNPEDETRMRFCLTYLHQVLGTLQMVEFYGAALLAEEMENLAQALLNGAVARVADAQEVLMRAILQLPPYLERVKISRRDLPVVLLPLLNDLRAARGDSLLSETALFKPDLGIEVSAQDVAEENPEFPKLMKKVRQMYQIALVGVIRSDKLAENFNYMMKVALKLEKVSGNTAMAPLWPVVAALVESLAQGKTDLGTSIKMLLGNVDRQLKRLVDNGSTELNEPVPQDLLKNLLYYIAKSSAETPRIKTIKEQYRLVGALPTDELINEERAAMAGPDRDTMSSVVNVLSEELGRIKDALDFFVRTSDKDMEKLKELGPNLKQVSDTIAVLGMGPPRKMIQEQQALLDEIIESGEVPEDSVLLDMAGALLYVESTLKGMSGGGDGDVIEVRPDHLGAAQAAVLRESRAGLEKAKDAIIEFIASQWDREHLSEVPGLLNAVRGGLQIIPLLKPAALLGRCIDFINEQLLGSDATPEWKHMDTLADAITSVEYYLERLDDNQSSDDYILDIAQDSVASLGYPLGESFAASDEDEESAEAVSLDETPVPEEAAGAAETSPGDEAMEAGEALSFEEEPSGPEGEDLPQEDVVEAPTDSLPEADSLPEKDAGLGTDGGDVEPVEEITLAFEEESAESPGPEPESVAEESIPQESSEQSASLGDELSDELAAIGDAVSSEPAASETIAEEEIPVEESATDTTAEISGEAEAADSTEPAEEDDDDLIDDEIIEIFVEEAGEVLETLDEYFPRWAANQEDEEALVEFRRAFHTLKGSGRMVGASVVGELAWSIENMMNRVIDKTIEATPILIELVRTVHSIIPDLVDAFAKQQPAPFDVAPLEKAAFTLAEGGSIDAIPNVRDEGQNGAETPAETEAVEPEAVAETPEVKEETGQVGDAEETDASMEPVVSVMADEVPAIPEVEEISLDDVPEETVVTEAIDKDAIEPMEAGLLGETLEPAEDSDATGETIELDVVPVPETEEPEDTTLLEIFASEAETHLEDIRQYLDSVDHDLITHEFPDDMIKALHTLKGSARMTELEPIALIAENGEKLFRAFRNQNRKATGEAIALLEEAYQLIQAALKNLAAAANGISGAAEYHARLEQCLQTLDQEYQQAQEEQGVVATGDSEANIVSRFLSEGADLVFDAEEILDRWATHPEPGEELDQLRDELGTLVASARSASLVDVADLCDALKAGYDAVAETPEIINDRFLEAVRDGHEALVNMMDFLAANQQLKPATEIIQDIREILSTATNQPISVSSAAEQSGEADEPGSEEPEPDPETHEAESVAVSAEEIPAPNPLPVTSAMAAVSTEPAPERDADLVEIFLEEAEEIMDSVSNSLQQWITNPDDLDVVKSLQRDLHTLKGGARMAEIPELGDLGHELENLYEGLTEGRLSAQPALFDLLHACQDRLADMIDGVRDGYALNPASDLIGQINAYVANPEGYDGMNDPLAAANDEAGVAEGPEEAPENGKQPEMDRAVEQQAVSAEPEEPSPAVAEVQEAPDADEKDAETTIAAVSTAAVSSEPAPERDADLVEIFLEEAEEIMDSVSNSLQQWITNPDDLDVVKSLQRDLHTLKGGARMAEIPELGDLGHELENLYEGLTEGRLSAQPALFDLLHACQDRLADMIDGVRDGYALNPASDLIAQINAYVANPEGFSLQASPQPASGTETGQPQATSPAGEPETATVEIPDDVDEDILDIFLEESDELGEALDAAVTAWRQNREDRQHSDELKRLLHTLKGGARLAGMKALGDTAHEFESWLIEADFSSQYDDTFFDNLQNRLDRVIDLLAQVKTAAGDRSSAQTASAGPVEEEPAAPAKSEAAKETSPSSGAEIVPLPVQREPEAAPPAPAAPASEPARPETRNKPAQAQRQPQEMVRVDAELLEQLVNLAGETSINRGRIEQGVNDFMFSLEDMGSTIDRLYEQLRKLDVETETQIMSNFRQGVEAGEYDEDFDPLEMDQYSQLNQLNKQLVESASDLMDIRSTLLDRVRDTETLLLQQSRVNTELQEGLMRTRMVPFSRLVPRLRRIIRQVSGEVGKKVDFDVVNPEGELDRTLLERIVAPLEHMLRNAVDHGIEPPAEREAAGKPVNGKVTLTLGREGGEVVLTLQDDGKGIDVAAVRKKAVERGLMDKDASLSDTEIMQFIFQAGFSTAAKVTQISGRGVGMDVVASEIKQMGGTVEIGSVLGQGTTFTVRLPFTVAMNRALMVRAGEEIYAIPLAQIEGIVRVSPYELETYYQPDAPDFDYAGRPYRMRYIGSFVYGNHQPNLDNQFSPLPVLLVRSADHPTAVQVDGLIGAREVVVKSVGPQLSSVAGISGATILGDGSVVIILDMLNLIRSAVLTEPDARVIAASAEEAGQTAPEAPAPARKTPTIMVTDDSVTVRKVTGRFLERNGFEVVTAKDGVDAVGKLADFVPDLMLLDIEMPRMDGFEVASHVRHDERLKEVPIIMITSRTGEKHRERAFGIGVNAYLGKPFQEQELLDTINELLEQARSEP